MIKMPAHFMMYTVYRAVYFGMARYALLTLVILAVLFFGYNKSVLATDVISAARVGLTEHTTRITLESNRPIQYELSMLENPGRVFIDLENVAINHVIKSLPDKLKPDNPFIERIRFGQFKPHIVRVVFDLKMNVVPRAFVIKPKENYGYRLVLDIYHPDKAAIAEKETLPEESLPVFHDEEDLLGQFVAVLNRRKPVQLAMTNTNVVFPNSYLAAKKRKPVPPRLIIVAIDPGHGGKDPGAVGKNGAREKDITLSISRKLKTIIDNEPHMRAILTRDKDVDLPLQKRQEIARQHNADMFVSIHADGSPRPHAHGSSVYTLSEHGATSTTASWLAQHENNTDKLVGGVNITSKPGDMQEIILDLSMSATINDSVKAAEFILRELGQINRLHKDTVEQAGFVVLKSPDIPSILVETAFITNPNEEKRLTNRQYQKKMANAIFSGIKSYFATNPALARTEVARAP